MNIKIVLAAFALVVATVRCVAADPTLILYHGRIVTVDDKFTVHEAMAITGDRITAVGRSAELLTLKGGNTKIIDLQGRMVLPGLIDSHVHPGAAMTEFDHEIPVMETITDVLAYIRSRVAVSKPGDWIFLRQIFITRLKEQRYPTRAELDEIAPENPVNFSTGPDNMLNTAAMKASGIDRDFTVKDGGPGFIEKDPKTGEPTGLLRGLDRFVKMKTSTKSPTKEEQYQRTLQLFRDYNSTGLTSIGDRGGNAASVAMYEQMLKKGELPLRIAVSHTIPTIGSMDGIAKAIDAVASHPLRAPNPRLRIIGTKIWLDGGMLTGSAYMREPWGVSQMYGITDPQYRGVLNVPPDRLLELVRKVSEAGLQFTAHSVGDGAVHTLLDTYETVAKTTSIRDTRPCFTHSNFMSREAIDRIAALGGVVDLQPAWLYLDTRTLQNQFGYDRLRYFQPLKSLSDAGVIAGGGSDHMQKIGSLRSVNPYNPFLGMWVAITRQARWYEGTVHKEEALSREQAIRFYTRNNAHLLFLEKEVGTLEPGKRADFIILNTDILKCPEERIKDTKVVATYLDGEMVYVRQ